RGLISLHCKAEELLSRAWASWVGSEAFAWVEYLHLRQRGGWLGVRMREVADLPALTHLAFFDLGGNGLGATDLRWLLKSPYLVNLHTLDLSFNNVDPAGAVSMDELGLPPRLHTLLLVENDLRDAGGIAL